MIHHVQVACPAGGEDHEREFYSGALGWQEIAKPPLLAVRGGCWFRVPGVGGPDGEVHVGIEDDFRSALKAHPAFVVDVDATAAALTSAGYPVNWADPEEIPGRRRFHTSDGVGNRIEFVAAQ
ncbi:MULTISPECIES: glyoxalase [unclassified Rhodococcus (in: high G+C Gram-positive bacteria)]|uniref:glyoxalase n=1 Tax=unclassified Rhodococcus (in: high G+C Gram-positive bacteria) TaxID=192944 RepID=UPI000B9B03EA|nr:MULTISPECIES: glyoxalase [unclassified Rhodococcus (in: high G+C Gram-positive bacteria)]OZE42152.1 glyoxalase [Rhodococcus sp. 05-2254-4]OZE49918.1 glyoxalase [Rhodococcus sp. 05-2254-3]OZE50556.1 glyoxalase [Rhodococcus sp. 05-2254-2]